MAVGGMIRIFYQLQGKGWISKNRGNGKGGGMRILCVHCDPSCSTETSLMISSFASCNLAWSRKMHSLFS